jgi:hypothetical protein
MKKKYAAKLILPLLCISLFNTCRKGGTEPNSSPTAFNEYFVCYYDSTYWTPCDGLMGSVNYTHGEYHTNGDYFLVWARIACAGNPLTYSEINLKFKNLNDTASYDLNELFNQGIVQGPKTKSNGVALVYNTDNIHTGKLVLTKYDKQGKNLSGKFYFDAFNVDSNHVIHISKGEFLNVNCVIY